MSTTQLVLRPITLRAARRFIADHHRHNLPPRGWLFGVALELDGEVVAVGMAGRPLARALDDGCTLEVLRVCTLGHVNAASRVYGALCRAAAALGYIRVVTYTLESEPGTSLRASGFQGPVLVTPHSTWASGAGARGARPRYDTTLWGDKHLPDERRLRWERQLG